MRQEECRIVACGVLASGHCLIEVDATPLGQPARAGQFVMVRTADGLLDPLRHPVFFSRGGHHAQLLVPLGEPWQTGLSMLAPEETLNALGPLGQPWEPRPGASHLLVLALTEPVAPALAAAHWAQRQGTMVSLVLGHKRWLPLAELLPAAVECTVADPNDWSALLEPLRWADQVLAVLEQPAMPRLADTVTTARLRLVPGFADVLLKADFLCGAGICGACEVEGVRHRHRVCSEGPLFDLVRLT